MSVGMYVGGKEETPIVFDSGYSISVTPNTIDLCGPITPLNNTTIRRGDSAHVENKGLLIWTFRDGNGVN